MSLSDALQKRGENLTYGRCKYTRIDSTLSVTQSYGPTYGNLFINIYLSIHTIWTRFSRLSGTYSQVRTLDREVISLVNEVYTHLIPSSNVGTVHSEYARYSVGRKQASYPNMGHRRTRCGSGNNVGSGTSLHNIEVTG